VRELILSGGKGIDFGIVEPGTFPVYRIITPEITLQLQGLLPLFFHNRALVFLFYHEEIQDEKTALFSLIALSCSMSWFYFQGTFNQISLQYRSGF